MTPDRDVLKIKIIAAFLLLALMMYGSHAPYDADDQSFQYEEGGYR